MRPDKQPVAGPNRFRSSIAPGVRRPVESVVGNGPGETGLRGKVIATGRWWFREVCRDFVVGAVRVADGMGAEHGHDELGAAETVLDVAQEVRARADLPHVAPDLVPEEEEVLIEAVGQLLGIAESVAEE